MDNEGLVSIGVVGGSFGVRGELKVLPLTDYPERFQVLKEILLVGGPNRERLTVEENKPHGQFYLFKFQGINGREAAERYRGWYLMIPESEIYPLPEGSYYYFQLKGLSVYDRDRGRLGVLQDILETGANDVYVIDSEQYGEILIPAIKEVVLKVDLEQGEMHVHLLPGLLD
ncbi:MAG TPA: ribosome maturation factor RimM [Syntrophomonadaceae bacterium]|nr:ribosome maturation factor RimM [Syntrophomonadaceae bacterium]